MPVSTFQSNEVTAGSTPVQPKFAKISAASSGENVLVAAVTDKKIRVHNIVLVAGAAVTVYFKDAASGTAIAGDGTNGIALDANGGFAPGEAILGHFQTATGGALVLNLSGAISVGGWVVYTEVD